MQRAKGTDRLLDVLDCVMALNRPLTRNAIAAEIGAPRSTVYSVIDMLLGRGYLDQTETEGLILPGSKCGLLGYAYDKHGQFGRKARQIVSKVAQRLGDVVELDILREWRQIVLISETGRGHNYRVALEGSSASLPLSASGRFLLQGIDRRKIEANIPDTDYIAADGTKISVDQFLSDMETARRQGYWIARGLIDPYIGCIASPVLNRSMRCIGTVCLVVPLPELALREEEFIALAREAADELTQLSISSNASIEA